MKKTIITNNKTVYLQYKDRFGFIFSDSYTYKDVLEITRSKIHEGYRLLTHPLSGSIKPNETPFKTIIISKEKGELDYQSLAIIEESIIVFNKFNLDKETPNWPEKILDDFRVVDFSLIENVIEKFI
ncbi:MAG: GrdX family protein [Tissierella sp.]|uniref:GrdX family protein n=1 Tax=Tissierella sp. TaxID=41274 RepID=UPI003F9B07E6